MRAVRAVMAAAEAKATPHVWPIVYGHPPKPTVGAGTALAWVLFLLLGLPFALMTVLNVLANSGIYVRIFSPLWQPWPPEVLKPFVGVAVFAGTLAFLAYRLGHRRGFRSGVGIGLSATRPALEEPSVAEALEPPAEEPAVPPPPPPPDAADDIL